MVFKDRPRLLQRASGPRLAPRPALDLPLREQRPGELDRYSGVLVQRARLVALSQGGVEVPWRGEQQAATASPYRQRPLTLESLRVALEHADQRLSPLEASEADQGLDGLGNVARDDGVPPPRRVDRLEERPERTVDRPEIAER